ncbi:MAG: hypothetical protein JSR76_05965 [Verrucomicrobia bacterium]|nr:hypothetical protein [Verrucomicrobiota bacterium]
MTLEIAGAVHNLLWLKEQASQGRLKPSGVAWLKHFVTLLNSAAKTDVEKAIKELKDLSPNLGPNLLYPDILPKGIRGRLLYPIRSFEQKDADAAVKAADRICDNSAKITALRTLILATSSGSEDDESTKSSPTTVVSVPPDAA